MGGGGGGGAALEWIFSASTPLSKFIKLTPDFGRGNNINSKTSCRSPLIESYNPGKRFWYTSPFSCVLSRGFAANRQYTLLNRP